MKKIMFNDRMGLTKAVLNGNKTQTRRIVKTSDAFERVNPDFDWDDEDVKNWKNDFASRIQNMTEEEKGKCFEYLIKHPKYKIGEVVAIAQSYRDCGGINKDGMPNWDVIYEAVGTDNAGWDNKMFVRADLMPHQIQITNIKIERLQDISDEDCLKEGILHRFTMQDGTKIYHTPHVNGDYDLSTDNIRHAFAYLINKTCGKKTWENNPYVFVYEFKLVK